MKIYNKFKKIICCALLLIVLSITCSGCHFNITTENPSSSRSSSQSSSSTKNSSSTGNFAMKYKNQEMDFDEYKMIMFYMITGLSKENQSSIEKGNLTLEEFVRSGSFEGQPAADWIKQSSVGYAKLALIAREKLKQAGKDLSQERKTSLDSLANESLSKMCNISLNGIKNARQDHERLKILKQEKIDVSDAEMDEVAVNENVIGKIDIFDLAKSAQTFLTKKALDWN